MDYRKLLLKYMEYINDMEGTDFTGKSLSMSNLFSGDEIRQLRELSESNSYRNNAEVKFRKTS